MPHFRHHFFDSTLAWDTNYDAKTWLRPNSRKIVTIELKLVIFNRVQSELYRFREAKFPHFDWNKPQKTPCFENSFWYSTACEYFYFMSLNNSTQFGVDCGHTIQLSEWHSLNFWSVVVLKRLQDPIKERTDPFFELPLKLDRFLRTSHSSCVPCPWRACVGSRAGTSANERTEKTLHKFWTLYRLGIQFKSELKSPRSDDQRTEPFNQSDQLLSFIQNGTKLSEGEVQYGR